MAAGCLFRLETLALQDALLILGILVTFSAGLAFLVRFTPQAEAEEQRALQEALAARRMLMRTTS